MSYELTNSRTEPLGSAMTAMTFELFTIVAPCESFPHGLSATAPEMARDSYTARLKSAGLSTQLASETTTRMLQRAVHDAITATADYIGRELTEPEAREAWRLCTAVQYVHGK